MVQALLDAGLRFELEAIQYAYGKGHMAVTKLLLARPLSQKACVAQIGITSAEIQKALDLHESTRKRPNSPGSDSSTMGFDHFIASLLIDTCRSGNARLVDILLQVIHLGPVKIHTALCAAAYSKQSSVLQMLIRYGTDINECDKMGMAALHQAAKRYDADTMCVLLDSGADVSALDKSAATALVHVCKASDRRHDTSLAGLDRLRARSVRAAQVLTDAGADLAAIDPENEDSLYKAVRAGKDEIVRFLLSRGANPNICRGRDLHTVLSLAARDGRTQIVQALLDNGTADINAEDFAHRSALCSAIDQGHSSIVEMLLEKGARVRHAGVSVSY